MRNEVVDIHVTWWAWLAAGYAKTEKTGLVKLPVPNRPIKSLMLRNKLVMRHSKLSGMYEVHDHTCYVMCIS